MSSNIIQNKNENVIYRKIRKTISSKGYFNTDGLYEKIISELSKSEKVYSFPDIEERSVSIYNINTFNPLLMHEDQMYLLFKTISELVKKTCLDYEFSYSKNKYFIYSSLVENQDPFLWYDAGGTSRPAMFGIVSLDSKTTSLFINDTEFDLEPGGIIISEAGNKIVYSEEFKSLVFYVSPLSEIKNQYSQKWIPLV